MKAPVASNFGFLQVHHPQLVRLGVLAEQYFPFDANTSLLKVRQFAELLAQLTAAQAGIYATPEESQLDILRRLEDSGVLPREIGQIFHEIRRSGNKANHALHDDRRAALTSLKFAWQAGLWFHRTFKDGKFKPGPFIPPSPPADPSSDLQVEINRLSEELAKRESLAAEQSELLSELAHRLTGKEDERSVWEQLAHEAEQEKAGLLEKLAVLQSQAAAAPATLNRVTTASSKAAQQLQLDEAATRDLIDSQLQAAGWEANSRVLRYAKGARPEPNRNLAIAEWPAGDGQADYVLFCGMRPVAVVEAKRKAVDVAGALQQAEKYSRQLLQSQFEDDGQRWGDFKIPFAFATNGRAFLRQVQDKSGIWFRDLRQPYNHGRPLENWYTPDGLKALLKLDAARAHQQLDNESLEFYHLQLRPYQRRVIRAIETAIAQGQRRALVAMATGTGKTKTCIALLYRLLKAQRFRRILFLVDRSALGEQAAKAFEGTKLENLQTFAETFNIQTLDDDAVPNSSTTVQIATVQGMVRRVLYGGDAKPPVDQYDCIVVDECHRGYLLDRELSDEEFTFRNAEDYISKYTRVLDSFDAVKIGLTATPALHTVQLFGQPSEELTYSYREAVLDGFLVDYEPPYEIETELSTQGILFEPGAEVRTYNPRSQQMELFQTPDALSFDVEHFNRRVLTESFNQVVCDTLAQEIDPSHPAKTLIFCVNDAHADLVVRLLKKSLEAYGPVDDDTVMKITGKANDPLKLIRRFKNERLPSIAVTVDLLTTGIDVPEISNLVFLRRVNSRILFDQMLGRATRLCDKIGKQRFRVFDAVRLFETIKNATAMQPVAADPKLTFTQLARELSELTEPTTARDVLDKFVAKLQSRKRFLSEAEQANLQAATGGLDAEGLITHLRSLGAQSLNEFFTQHPDVGAILDTRGDGPDQRVFISEHEDRLVGVSRDFGASRRPEDYLLEFNKYIRENQDRLPAVTAVVTRPQELTRQQLRELMLVLDQAGFKEANLDIAWRETTNQEMAARLVGYIRQAALNEPLMPYEERVDRALQKLLASRPWTTRQRDWLKVIGKQMKANTVVDREAIDHPDSLFREEAGGFERLDRIFDGNLATILQDLHASLWQ